MKNVINILTWLNAKQLLYIPTSIKNTAFNATRHIRKLTCLGGYRRQRLSRESHQTPAQSPDRRATRNESFASSYAPALATGVCAIPVIWHRPLWPIHCKTHMRLAKRTFLWDVFRHSHALHLDVVLVLIHGQCPYLFRENQHLPMNFCRRVTLTSSKNVDNNYARQ